MRVCPECRASTEAEVCPHDRALTIDEELLAAGNDSLIGRLIGQRYRPVARIGLGGMGRIYLAEQVAFRRKVVVKVVREDLLDDPDHRDDILARFRREAQAASRLQHPNTIKVLDFGATEDGVLFLVMECLKGRTLHAELRECAPLEPARMLRIAVQVAKSLDEAHRHGIVHRDLKPDNIFLAEVGGERDIVKVLDFGIAKVLDETSGLVTGTGAGRVLGTPAYMAPEQAMSRPVSPATDLYALGVVLYEGLSGRRPFNKDTPLATLMAHIQEPVPPLVVDGFPPGVSPALEAYVRLLLDKDPERRPGPAAKVASDLDALLAECEAGTTPSQGPPSPASSPRTTEVLPTPTSRTVRPRPWTRALVIAAGLAGGVGLGLWAYSHLASPRTPGPEDMALSPDAASGPVTDLPTAMDPAFEVLPGEDLAVNNDRTPPPAAKPPLPPPPKEKSRALPRCDSLTCPFIEECLADQGRPLSGREYCIRSLPRCTTAWCDSRRGEYCRDPSGNRVSRAAFCEPPLPLCSRAWCRQGLGPACRDAAGKRYPRDDYCMPGE